MIKLRPDESGYVTYQGQRVKFQPDAEGNVLLPENALEQTSEYNLKEAMKEDDMDPGNLELVRDHPRFSEVTKVRAFEGYFIARLNPFGHWLTLKRISGQPIPLELQGSFTTIDSVKRAILKYLERME